MPLVSEPRELDKDGKSSLLVRGMSMAGTMVLSGCGGQQRVSRAQTLQLKYSNLLPSGMVLEHFEKTAHRSMGCVKQEQPPVTHQSTCQTNSPRFLDQSHACEQHSVAEQEREAFRCNLVPACGQARNVCCPVGELRQSFRKVYRVG